MRQTNLSDKYLDVQSLNFFRVYTMCISGISQIQ